ncbi:MAG: hypothetical protein KF745_15140 [Phycisphaeraceae bacterium]|nr:hypothetical protein [Phycisphaeraceae bacterium]
MTSLRSIALSAAALVILTAGGCTTYYTVSDVATGKTYYTTKVDRENSGAVKFVDEKSGGTITLQSSDVRKVSKERYEEGIYANPAPTAPSAPTAPAAPTPPAAPAPKS